MHFLIEQIFKKRGIDSIDELKDYEKDDFDRWQSILSDPEGEVSLESVQKFCENQISLIETQWKNMDNSPSKNERLVILHTTYRSILGAIFNPKRAEREALEKHLQSLL